MIPYNLEVTIKTVSMSNLSETKQKIAYHHYENGKKCFSRGEIQGLSHFEEAIANLPNDPEFIYKQAMCLLSFGEQKRVRKYLLIANKNFKKAFQLSSNSGKILHGWGKSLFALGKITESNHFYLESREKYTQAHHLYKKQNLLPEEFNLEFARITMKIAHNSNEACDFAEACKMFAKEENAQQEKSFWIDYALCCEEIFKRNNCVDLLEKAISCYKKALSDDEHCASDWLKISNALSMLYQTNKDTDTLQNANDCFATATKLNPIDPTAWIKWANLLKDAAVHTGEEKKFHAALEKCRRARFLSPHSKECTLLWAETLSLMGASTNDLSLLHEAKNKVLSLEALSHQDPDILYVHGVCLISYAHYYQDLDYYYQAAEKFQEALSKDSSSAKCWHALGRAHAHAYVIDNDAITIDRGIRFLEKALYLSCQPTYYLDYAHLLSLKGENEENELLLEQAANYFEQGFNFVNKKYFIEAKWHIKYAQTLDLLGDFKSEDHYYFKALNILVDCPVNKDQLWEWHYQVATTYAHLGEIEGSEKYLLLANDHFKLAYTSNEDIDSILIDWGLNLINLSELSEQKTTYLKQAEYKIMQALKLGNKNAFYYLSCIYSLLKDEKKAVIFLQKSHRFDALPDTNVILNDSWLDYVRHTDYFSQFMNCLEEV